MKKMWALIPGCAILATAGIAYSADLGSCNASYAIKPSDKYRAVAADAGPVRRLQPAFFGFNLEWLEFQSALWDKQRGAVNQDAENLLAGFPGAVYRYPGGTNADYFAWREGVGTPDARPAGKRATWTDSTTINFGPAEYLKFVKDVGGQAWYVTNIYGAVGQEQDNAELAQSAGDLADFLRGQKAAGMPAVLRWELGNELDRDVFRWPPQKLVGVSLAAAKQIRQRDPDAQVVSMLEEYPARQQDGFSASAYNKTVAGAVKSSTSEFAIHLYYDGKPTPPLRQALSSMCYAIDDARAAGIGNPTVWITEYARVPDGAWSGDWKNLWPQTADLQAAISDADMVIATAQMPEVNGAMIHALHASDGPWPTMHRSRADGHIYPSAVLIALRMLRDTMLPNVLATRNESANAGAYAGGYDMRAVVMTDDARKKYSVWAVNRSGKGIDLNIAIPALKGRSMNGKIVTLSDDNPKANNYASQTRLQPSSSQSTISFNADGVASVGLPPYAVATINFQ
ncbi:MAG: hypothetical protein JO002_14430 [Burkholderiaceae bacterium]|nr:hypothetical protein [Burkholderiaceae bacterium]